MNPIELYETTLRKDTRVLKKITIDDYTLCSDTVSKLMGSDTSGRKELLDEDE